MMDAVMRALLLVLLATFLIAANPARSLAQQPAVQPPATDSTPRQPATDPPADPQASIFSYGEANPGCQSWTNACQACSRGENGAPLCSNIGIACQPQAVTCTARRPDQPPP
jgi:hypothetical protein